MKSLYEKLSQENQAKLEEMGKQFPFTYAAMKKELENTYSFLELNYGTALELVRELNNENDVKFFSYVALFEENEAKTEV